MRRLLILVEDLLNLSLVDPSLHVLPQKVYKPYFSLLATYFVLGLIDEFVVASTREKDCLDQPPGRSVLDQDFRVLYVDQLIITQKDLLSVDLRICQAPCCLDADVSAASHDFRCVQSPNQVVSLVQLFKA